MTWATEQRMRQLHNTYVITDGADDDINKLADAGVIAAAIEAADEEASSYATVRYPHLTTSYTGTVPTILKIQASRLAIAIILERGGRGALAERIRDVALEWFEKLVDGNLVLPGETSGGLADSTSRGVELSFGSRQLDDYGEPSPRVMEDGDENDPLS